jgi:hypothetical protein
MSGLQSTQEQRIQHHEHHFVYFSADQAPLAHESAVDHAQASCEVGEVGHGSTAAQHQTARARHYEHWALIWAQQPRKKGYIWSHQSSLADSRCSTAGQEHHAHSELNRSVTGTGDQSTDSTKRRSPDIFFPLHMSLQHSFERKVGMGHWASVPLRSMFIDDYMFALRTLLYYAPKRTTTWLIQQLSIRESTFAVLQCFQRLLSQAPPDNSMREASAALFWLRRITCMARTRRDRYFVRSDSEITHLRGGFARMQAVQPLHRIQRDGEGFQLVLDTEQFMRSGIRITSRNFPSSETLQDPSLEEPMPMRVRQKWIVHRITEFNGVASSTGEGHERGSGVFDSLGKQHPSEGTARVVAGGDEAQVARVSGSSEGAVQQGSASALSSAGSTLDGLVGRQWALEQIAKSVPRISEVRGPCCCVS